MRCPALRRICAPGAAQMARQHVGSMIIGALRARTVKLCCCWSLVCSRADGVVLCSVVKEEPCADSDDGWEQRGDTTPLGSRAARSSGTPRRAALDPASLEQQHKRAAAGPRAGAGVSLVSPPPLGAAVQRAAVSPPAPGVALEALLGSQSTGAAAELQQLGTFETKPVIEKPPVVTQATTASEAVNDSSINAATPTTCALCGKPPGDSEMVPVKVDKQQKSVVHLNCALWAPEAYECEGQWHGLSKAVKRGRRLRCDCCKKFGAVVGCVEKACKGNYHFTCLAHSDWMLNYAKFQAACPAHVSVLVLQCASDKTKGEILEQLQREAASKSEQVASTPRKPKLKAAAGGKSRTPAKTQQQRRSSDAGGISPRKRVRADGGDGGGASGGRRSSGGSDNAAARAGSSPLKKAKVSKVSAVDDETLARIKDEVKTEVINEVLAKLRPQQQP